MAVASPLTCSVAGTQVPTVGVWEFDPGHTEAAFAGTHLMMNTVRGRFEGVSGRLEVAERPEASWGELLIESSSLTSGFGDRDKHLKGPEWLDVERYPQITFRSRGLEFVTSGTWQLFGDLTIKGITHPIEARASFGGGFTDPWGNEKIGFAITAEIDREQWDLRWNLPLDSGGWVVSRRVWLNVDVEAVRRTRATTGE